MLPKPCAHGGRTYENTVDARAWVQQGIQWNQLWAKAAKSCPGQKNPKSSRKIQAFIKTSKHFESQKEPPLPSPPRKP
jgi:hypothetical protein